MNAATWVAFWPAQTPVVASTSGLVAGGGGGAYQWECRPPVLPDLADDDLLFYFLLAEDEE